MCSRTHCLAWYRAALPRTVLDRIVLRALDCTVLRAPTVLSYVALDRIDLRDPGPCGPGPH